MKSRYVKKINRNDELISDIMYLKNLNINRYYERYSFLYDINNIFNYDLKSYLLTDKIANYVFVIADYFYEKQTI